MPNTENFDQLKKQKAGKLTYRLRNANVYVAPGGFHYIDYFDDVEHLPLYVDPNALTEEESAYIEHALQSNHERFENQAQVVERYLPQLSERTVLDVGCGGGLLLSKLRDKGAQVKGIELSDARIHFARSKHNLDVFKRPVESDFWQDQHATLDALTLWDVIEHVNFPTDTLRAAINLLKKDGLIFIDTPCRDCFYHRVGEFTYKVSGGRFPTFLNAMYSAHLFGHKQIFSTTEIRVLLEGMGVEVLELKKFHELSFPYRFYLEKMLKSKWLVELFLPVVRILLFVVPIKNKMLVVGRKK